MCQSESGQNWGMRRLAIKPFRIPGLVLDHWWVELGSKVAGCWLRFSELILTFYNQGHDWGS